MSDGEIYDSKRQRKANKLFRRWKKAVRELRDIADKLGVPFENVLPGK